MNGQILGGHNPKQTKRTHPPCRISADHCGRTQCIQGISHRRRLLPAPRLQPSRPAMPSAQRPQTKPLASAVLKSPRLEPADCNADCCIAALVITSTSEHTNQIHVSLRATSVLWTERNGSREPTQIDAIAHCPVWQHNFALCVWNQHDREDACRWISFGNGQACPIDGNVPFL